MNIFKRALISISANKGRTVLLGFIFFLVMAAITAVVIVGAQYKDVQKELFKDGSVPVSVSAKSPSGLIGMATFNWDDYKDLKPEQNQQIAELDVVESYNRTASQNIIIENLDTSKYTEDESGVFVSYEDKLEDSYGIEFNIESSDYVSNPGLVLNDELLVENNLEIGDKVVVDFNGGLEGETITEISAVEVPIAGTYTVNVTQEMKDEEQASAEMYDYEADLSFSYLYTNVYLPMSYADHVIEVVEPQLGDEISDILYVSYDFNLKSINDLTTFETQAEEITGFELDVNVYPNDESGLSSVFYAIEGMKWLLIPALQIIIGILCTLLIAIMVIIVRSRKKEIGILVALGEKRLSIYFQIVIEQLLIMTMMTIIAYPVVYAVLLKVFERASDSAQINILPLPIVMTLGIGVALVFVATLIPAVYTMKVSPKKILL